MVKMNARDRILLLLTALLAAYQVVVGVDSLDTLSLVSYTISFGVLLVAALLLVILGWEILDSPLVVIISTIIPLGLSLGMVSQYIPDITTAYLTFTILGFFGVMMSRYASPGRLAVLILAVVHVVAGMTIFLLPIVLSLRGDTNPGFALVGLGGGLIGIGGLLLSFLKTGKPILSRENILAVFPWLLLIMTGCFVAGFALI